MLQMYKRNTDHRVLKSLVQSNDSVTLFCRVAVGIFKETVSLQYVFVLYLPAVPLKFPAVNV